LDFKQLQVFLVTAESLNFTKASQTLGLTHSSVSYQIAALEENVGVQLFHRDKHKVKLTPAGRGFYYEVRELAEAYEKAKERAKKRACGEIGEVFIGFLGGAERRFLPLFIKRFQTSYPLIKLHIKRYDMVPLNSAMDEGRLDIGFTLSHGFEPRKGFVTRAIFSERLVVAMRHDHALASRQKISLGDLCQSSLIALIPQIAEPVKKWTEQVFARYPSAPRVTRWASDFESLFLGLEGGEEVVMIPHYRLAPFLNPRICYREIEEEEARVDFLAVWRESADNPALPIFLRELGLSPSTPAPL